MGLPQGTAERFDPATGSWIKLNHPVMGTGMDYLGGFTNVQDLPKGKAVTLRYRIALDASMTDGKGGVEATVVIPDPLVQIGKANLPLTVVKDSTTPAEWRQTVLPFTGLTYPSSVAVDSSGNIYVADNHSNRVVKLAAGSNDQTVLPFTGLRSPGGLAVDAAGDVFVVDSENKRVVKLAAGSNDQTVLPLTGLDNPRNVAVDSVGNVYVTEYAKGDAKVVKLAAGSTDQSVLPLTGIKSANDVAVDGTGSVYVTDGSNRQVVKFAAASSTPTVVPSTGLFSPSSVAVDAAGNVYVVDSE
ncbi:MAG: hypothetical protein JWN40_4272, partial [Phycisphaerales bacterium]|nr:hypothetical protein [Phycisphaerales bacterium]